MTFYTADRTVLRGGVWWEGSYMKCYAIAWHNGQPLQGTFSPGIDSKGTQKLRKLLLTS
jgi:hypothetical protein